MLHPFISSQARTTGRLGVTALSAAVHAILIAAAVAATTRSMYLRDVREVPGESVERVVLTRAARFVTAASRLAARDARRAMRRPPRAARLTLPDASALRLPLDLSAAVADAMPDVVLDADFAAMASESIEFADGNAGDLVRTLLGHVLPSPTRGGAYTQEVVDRTVWPRRGNPVPMYPTALLGSGVEASLLVRFVVDSTGRVDTKSIAFPPDAHRLFAAAVRDALLRSRYLPAELGGHRVRQLVEQQFSFRIVR